MPQETAQQEANKQETAPEEKGVAEDESEKEDEGSGFSPGFSNLAGPEGVMMLMIFGGIDILDFFVGSFWLIDVPAILIFFVWTTLRSKGQSQGFSISEKAGSNTKKVPAQAKNRSG